MQEFIERAHAAGIGIDPRERIIADDRIHRFNIHGRLTGAYRLKDEGGRVVGWVKDWRSGEQAVPFVSKSHNQPRINPNAWRERQVRAREELHAEHLTVAKDVQSRLQCGAKPGRSFAYIERKGIIPYRALLFPRWDFLAIPVHDEHDIIWNAQRIYSDGRKIFWKVKKSNGENYQGRVKGLWCDIGANALSSELVLCEGWATGCTIHEATGLPVRVCFFAANLPVVAEKSRRLRPDQALTIAADNDQWSTNKNGQPMNAGIIAADKCRPHAARVLTIHPPFAHPTRPTDFNDWALLYGKEKVRKIFEQKTQ